MTREERSMSPEDRSEKDAARWKHFDKIYYGKDNEYPYGKDRYGEPYTIGDVKSSIDDDKLHGMRDGEEQL